MEVEPPIVSKGKEIVRVSAAVCEERVASEPTVLQVQGSIGTQSTSMLIDSGSTHNLMSSKFASKLGLPVTKTEPCKVFLPNGESNPIDCRLLDVPVILQGTQTIANFEVWTGSQYDVILGMTWLNDVDAWIACKHGEVHGKLPNGKPFTIKGTRALPKIPLLSATQMKRCLRKKQEVFAIDIRKVSDKSESNCKEPINVEIFLAIIRIFFLMSCQECHLKERWIMLLNWYLVRHR